MTNNRNEDEGATSETTDAEPQASPSPASHKVLGEFSAADGAGVVGRNTSGTDLTYGVIGETESSNAGATGVRASAPNGGQGIHATASGNFAANVVATGYTAVKADTDGQGYNALHGENSASEGWSWGVRGDTDSSASEAYGVRGFANSNDGSPKGVGGSTNGTEDGAAGVIGEASGGGSNETYGVYGTSNSSAGFGVYSDGDSKTDGDQMVTGSQSIGNVGLSAYLSLNQTIDSGPTTTVAFDATNRDDFGGYDTSTGQYTVQTAGDYHVSFTIDWQTDFDEGVNIEYELQINGNYSGGIQADTVTATSQQLVCRCYSRTLFDLDEGDTLEVAVSQDSGSTADIWGSNQESYLTIYKVG